MGVNIKNILYIFIFLLVAACLALNKSFAQKIYSSRNGNTIPVEGEMRILNIFVNIIYDQTPEKDPFYKVNTTEWMPGNPNVLNDSPPSFMRMFLEPDTSWKGYPKGVMTRLFYEASFGKFIVLGDFMVVNIKQSEITPLKPGDNFDISAILDKVVKKINSMGGVKTIYGHNKLSDYDFFEKGAQGLPKRQTSNGIIDFVQVMIRNSVNKKDNNNKQYSFGQYNPGQGSTWASAICGNCGLLFGEKYCSNEMTSVQCIGDKNLSNDFKSIIFHEFAHNLFGDNSFHTSGGSHYATYSTCVFAGLEGGYGLMGGYNSSLVSCNGYERWRMGWTSGKYNPENLSIAASGQYSDISRESGSKKFVLRDFITTGDAIRIKLPVGDSAVAAQYLWLENHQTGKNNALDFFQYSNTSECRPAGTPGIYAYIQTGRDSLESNNYNVVFSPDFTDNLRFFSAEGNWDFYGFSDNDSVDCVTNSKTVRGERRGKPNPFTGYNDQQTHFYVTNTDKVLKDVRAGSYLWVKRGNGLNPVQLPFLGDDDDAFSGNNKINMGTNPAPVNVVTWFVKQGGGTIRQDSKFIPLKKIYLSGLGITMKEQNDGSYIIEIVWDDYLVDNDTRWTGDIVLSEKIILEQRRTIMIDQGEMPVQLTRDEQSGFFSRPSVLNVAGGAELRLLNKSRIVLRNGSTLIIGYGGSLILEKKSKIIVHRGCKLVFDEKSILINNGGKIKKR